MQDDLIVAWDQNGDEVTVHIAGEVDLANAAQVLTAGREALAVTCRQALVLDLRRVTFIDSAGIGACVALLKAALGVQRDASVQLLTPSVVRVFSVMGVTSAFDVRVSAG